MQNSMPDCFKCARFHYLDIDNNTCDAFPETIPIVIFFNGQPHKTTWSGEQTFSPISTDEETRRHVERANILQSRQQIKSKESMSVS